VDGLGRIGEMGSLHELRKLERSRAGDWQSTVSNGPNFESGERETWNMSITDRGENFGSTEQESGDQEGGASGPSSLAGEGRRPSERRTVAS
jgi:hypothetical protein